jgi:uncharacterized membrane protein
VSEGGSQHVEEAIEAIADLERQAQEAISPHQRWIERVTQRLGRPRTVYFIVVFVTAWVAANLILIAAHRPPFDPPPFSWLQGIVSLAALLMATLILTTANRIAQIDLTRDQLDLQINLLNERRTGKLIRMLDEMRRDSPELPTYHDPEVQQLSKPTDTHEVARAIEERTPHPPGAP